MDMKRILQAMDGVATKPVVGANDMARFLQVVTEGANPHKVTLPVQMAMQHYQKPKEEKTQARVGNTSVVGKYFHKVEQERLEEQYHKRQLINQYASTIAERVLMKESANLAQQAAIAKKKKKVKEVSPGFKPQGPGLQSNAPDSGHLSLSELSTDTLGKYKKAAYADAKKADAEGNYARGDKRFKGINKATTKQFDNDLKKHDQNPIKEANAKKRTLKNSNPCWKGYHPVGTKKKGGRTVPNCVPKE